MKPEDERKNRRIGWSISIGLHALLILLFFLMLAWREPDPPLPEYGIELNFGIDASGSGAIQPTQPTSVPEEPVEQKTEPQEMEPQEETSPPEIEEQEIIEEENVEQPVETQPQVSPDVIKPPVTTPQIVEEKVKEIKEVVQPEQEVTRNSEINQNKETTGTTDEVLDDQTSTSQGDDAEIEGDKGNREGTIDSRALYGSQGGGGGPLLELSGWLWDFEPNPRDTSNENGKIVFEIKIDDRGEIISVRTLEKTVSPEIERIYKQEVESLTFSPISSNTRPAPVSTGKITFIIRSK
jgi:outer membrane biosynthesis protein TonB